MAKVVITLDDVPHDKSVNVSFLYIEKVVEGHETNAQRVALTIAKSINLVMNTCRNPSIEDYKAEVPT